MQYISFRDDFFIMKLEDTGKVVASQNMQNPPLTNTQTVACCYAVGMQILCAAGIFAKCRYFKGRLKQGPLTLGH